MVADKQPIQQTPSPRTAPDKKLKDAQQRPQKPPGVCGKLGSDSRQHDGRTVSSKAPNALAPRRGCRIRHHEPRVIPVYEPYVGEEEAEAVAAAVRRGEISGSFGESIPAFEQRFAHYVGVEHGVAVTSGTTALQLAVAAAGVGPGDEVLVSASTNIATALAAFHNGAVPVAVDSEDETWNLDLDLLEGLITARTKAIIPVHLFGHPVDMDRLLEIAERHGLVVIEDCAESHGATVRGRMTGALGHMGCFSFYANKIITTGEGGMVTTDDDALAERLRLLRNLAFQTAALPSRARRPQLPHDRLPGGDGPAFSSTRSISSSSRSGGSPRPTTGCLRTSAGS